MFFLVTSTHSIAHAPESPAFFISACTGTMGAKAVSLTIVAAASVLIYWNTFYCGFVFDDHRAILTNDDLDASKTSFWGLFTNDFWGGLISRRESHKSYRPLTVLTYRYFNHHFSGLEPAGYHVVNVVLHAVASSLFLLVAEVALGDRDCWATYAALLFATHSIHTEAVSRPTLKRNGIISICLYQITNNFCLLGG